MAAPMLLTAQSASFRQRTSIVARIGGLGVPDFDRVRT
jgi:hypothetical protein